MQGLEQSARRQATSCDFKASVSEEIDRLVSDARASLQDRTVFLESGQHGSTGAGAGALDSSDYQSYVQSIEELLVEQHAILPPSVFGSMCEIRNAVIAFEETDRRLMDEREAGTHDVEIARLRRQFDRADRLYCGLVGGVRAFFESCA